MFCHHVVLQYFAAFEFHVDFVSDRIVLEDIASQVIFCHRVKNGKVGLNGNGVTLVLEGPSGNQLKKT